MEKILWSALALTCVLTVQTVVAQECDYVAEGKVQKLLEKSQDKKKYDSDKRYEFLLDAIDEDEYCFPALLELGESSFKRAKRDRQGFSEAEGYLKRIAEHCPEYHSRMWYFLGAIAYAEQRYDAALEAFDKFIHFPDDDEAKFDRNYDKKYEEVQEALPYVKFYRDFYRHGSELEARVVEGVSSTADDYLPALSPDGELMFYTRRSMQKAKGDLVSRQVEEFTVSERTDINSIFDDGEALPKPFNMGDNYGGASISVDNRELFIAKKNPVSGNPENIDLYVAQYERVTDERTGKKVYRWSELEHLGDAINTDMGWESQPSLSGDGKTLFFATVRENSTPDANGNPSTDIYFSERLEDGSWTPAKPIGGKINTPFNDKAPFMHSDSKTLYFASDRKPGGGGYDIWYTRQKDDGSWEDPKNIGAPINTQEDEHGMIVSADGKEAYFASRRVRGARGLDIYSFSLPEDARPESVVILKGTLTDENGGVPEGASVKLKYVQSKEVQEVAVDANDGHYATVVSAERDEDVVVSVEGDDMAFESRVVVDRMEKNQPSVVKLKQTTRALKSAESFVIPDIFYTTNSADIDRASKLILDEFAAYLKAHPGMVVEIGGHTDDRGSDADNLALSMDRAFEVKGYLEAQGVEGRRVKAKGYGETLPVDSNETEEGRANNRRTEFTILKM